MLFNDCSSAFNTIVPSKLVTKLRALCLNSSLCNWVLDFLRGRPQVMRVSNNISTKLIRNTGAPQGCAIKSILLGYITTWYGNCIALNCMALMRVERLLYSCEPENPAEGAVRKQILSLETLYSRLTSRGHGGADINTSKGDVEKDLLRVLSYQAESALAQENHQEAVACMQRCKDMLLRLPKETGYLSLMCYNFGVDSYNMKKYEESSFWLSQSYDIGKMNIKYSPGAEVQAKVLRLLATVYLKWDCQQFQEKALNAVNLANKDDHIRAGVTELLESEVPLEVCLSTVKLLMAEDRETLAFDYLKRVCQHFESSPELGSALVLHIELLLQRGKELLGKQKIEDIITGTTVVVVDIITGTMVVVDIITGTTVAVVVDIITGTMVVVNIITGTTVVVVDIITGTTVVVVDIITGTTVVVVDIITGTTVVVVDIITGTTVVVVDIITGTTVVVVVDIITGTTVVVVDIITGTMVVVDIITGTTVVVVDIITGTTVVVVDIITDTTVVVVDIITGTMVVVDIITGTTVAVVVDIITGTMVVVDIITGTTVVVVDIITGTTVVVVDIITGHYTGKQLSPQTLTCLHLLLWDKASKNFETKNFSEALQWYNYSLSFYKAGQMEPNLAKLQRNRASCLLQLQQLDKAKEAIKEAERCDPNSIFTQFSVYKIAVLENNVEKAAEAVKAIGALAQGPVTSEDRLLVAENAASNLLSLAAQIALENEQQDTAMKALESLCEHSKDEAQVLTALRCLVRLVLSTIEKASGEIRQCLLFTVTTTALQKVSQLSPGPSMAVEQRTEDANWFRKIAWNSALQCESSPDRMRDFFLFSYQLSQFCPPDRAVLMGQKTCLLMAAAASLELCRKSPHSDQTEQLTQALEHIQICWEVWKTLKASGDNSKDPTNMLLLLYEFEARAKLNDPKVETVLESVLELDNVEIKVLETMAALAMEPPAHFPLLCKKALRIALSLHRKQPQADLARCSQCVHSLIQLSLPSGVSDVEARVLEEVWGYYEEALSIITAPEDFPEMEILWLLTRAWNTGILLYSLAQYPEAERWCGLGMSFLRHLGSLQESYQTQMSGLYSEVLDRLDKAKKNLIMEE
ncbi:testis-expressed protein 11 [Salvelinus namaycush]|uniref:Protein ZIP4 homolog n=1 Tax=Salvelinus namaycush TaxID=8040 RepID=A0A8U0UCF2_SALNM|nr:testis-expressed protein 11 [Salvelinus namaycush]